MSDESFGLLCELDDLLDAFGLSYLRDVLADDEGAFEAALEGMVE